MTQISVVQKIEQIQRIIIISFQTLQCISGINMTYVHSCVIVAEDKMINIIIVVIVPVFGWNHQ